MIAPDEARDALADIDRARQRSVLFSGYARSGDILIAWGLVWLAGNIVSYIDPAAGGWCWGIGIAAAIIWTLRRSRGAPRNPRGALTALAMFGYLLLTELLIGGADARLHNALTSSLVAALYVGLGIWRGARFAVLGLALAAMILLGWFVFPATLYLWLGLGGGGALIVAGLWLRGA